MIIVLDTNVIISAFISSGTARDVFVYVVENHHAVVSPYILGELKEKLTRKLGFTAADYESIHRIVVGWTELREHAPGQTSCFSDAKDQPILDLCVTVKADLLITGDKKLRAMREVRYTRIIQPQEFWDIEGARH